MTRSTDVPKGVPANSPFSDAGSFVRSNGGADNQRLTHVFRATLKDGRIHPLYLPILKYRHSKSGL